MSMYFHLHEQPDTIEMPEEFRNYEHPEDYHVLTYMTTPQLYTVKEKSYFRYFAHIAWKISDNKYIPMSFMVETGAMGNIYLCKKAMKLLLDERVIDPNTRKVNIHTTKSEQVHELQCLETPRRCEPLNIIGLSFLKLFGLNKCSMKEDVDLIQVIDTNV